MFFYVAETCLSYAISHSLSLLNPVPRVDMRHPRADMRHGGAVVQPPPRPRDVHVDLCDANILATGLSLSPSLPLCLRRHH